MEINSRSQGRTRHARPAGLRPGQGALALSAAVRRREAVSWARSLGRLEGRALPPLNTWTDHSFPDPESQLRSESVVILHTQPQFPTMLYS